MPEHSKLFLWQGASEKNAEGLLDFFLREGKRKKLYRWGISDKAYSFILYLTVA
jgi:hypothetical protein